MNRTNIVCLGLIASLVPTTSDVAAQPVAPPPPVAPFTPPAPPSPPSPPGPSGKKFKNKYKAWKNNTPRKRVKRGYLGLSVVDDMTEALRQYFGAPADRGVLVSNLEKDSPAAKAGILVGDVLTEVDGEEIADADDLRDVIRNKKDGDKIHVTVVRNHRSMTIAAVVRSAEVAEVGFEDMLSFEVDNDWPGPSFPFEMDPDQIERLEEKIKKATQKIVPLSAKQQEALEERLKILEQRLQHLEKKTP